jgi:FkbM family methyltransferase
LGVRTVVPFFALLWRYPERYLPHYAHDLPHKVLDAGPEIRHAAALLSDLRSRREFTAQVRWRLNPASDTGLPGSRDDLYFPEDLIALRSDETFIDCGAFDGDTLRDFLQRVQGEFRRFVAFEPDPRNLVKLAETVESMPAVARERVIVEGMALSSHPETLWLSQHDAASAIGQAGDLAVRCDALDNLLLSVVPTFLKMDIEGAEAEALEGARGVISRSRPILAISAYHAPDHLWTLPLLIESIAPGYSFYYRRHTPFPDDDLVLYALPHERPRPG